MKIVKLKLTLIVVFSTLSFVLLGQNGFIENKGQWNQKVEFKLETSLHQTYFEKDGFTFNLIDGEALFSSSVHHGNHDVKSKKLEKIKAHAYKMSFLESNKEVQVKPQNAFDSYTNYYIGNNPENWAAEVKSFESVIYEDLYASIDLEVHWQNNGFKYDFIVKPEGSIEEIQMHFDGIDRIALNDGDIKIYTSVGKVIEKKPYVYQIIKGKKVEIQAEYVINNQNISYRLLEKYNLNYDLIIDPSLIFSTYSGSSSDNWGFTACSDQLGNVYSGGIVFNAGYPTTVGAYQFDFAGGESSGTTYLGCDITISKYNADGTTLLWASHIGGTTSEEMPHSLVVNQLNELVIFGTTGSTDYPTTTGAYDNSFNGGTPVTYDNVIQFSSGTDIIVSKLSADGSQLVASTFVGGSANDGINWRPYYVNYTMNGNDSLYYNYADGARGEVIVDSKSDIFVGSTTFSSDFPTINGFQLNSNGQQEGIVFKLAADLSQLVWSSYIGGSNDDAVFSLEINDAGETYVAGGTVSDNFPTTTNAYETTFQGGTADGFVAHISNVGSQLLASTYFGSAEYDQAYFVRVDKYNNVFITGQTKASGSTLIHNAIYNQPNSGQFIAKFLPSLETLDWSTTFGTGNGKPNISITAFAVDICNRVYLSGWGREWGGSVGSLWGTTFGTVGMEVTPDAEQSITDGQDFYIMVMYGDASALDYATFFGEQHYGTGYCGHDHVDGGTSRFDRMGNIYQSVCASCGNITPSGSASCNEFPTTTGAAFEDNGGVTNTWNCNNAVFRYSFAEDITIADFYVDPLVCETEVVQFTNTGVGDHYFWEFGDGTTSTEVSPTHSFPAPGVYQVMLYTIDSNTCNLTDTIVKSITIQDQVSQSIASANICLGDNIQIGITPVSAHTYHWIPTSGLSNSNIANPIASPTSTTDYTLVIDDNTCLDTIWQTVNVLDIQYQMQGIKDSIICLGESIVLDVETDAPVSTIIWSDNPLFTNVLNSGGASSITVSPVSNTNYYVMTLDSICQIERKDTVSIEIDIPQIDIQGEALICLGDSTQLSVQLLNGVVGGILWNPSSIISSGQGTASVLVQPTQNVWLSVEVENNRQCSVKDSVFIKVDDLQLSETHTDLLCNNVCQGSIELSYSGISPYFINWNSGQTDSQLYQICADTYFVSVTDSLGCSDTLSVIISEPPALSASITDVHHTGCASLWNTGYATATANGGTTPYSYLWSNGDQTATADSLPYGTYSVTIEDANQCQTFLSVNIQDPSNLVIGTTNNSISCFQACDGIASVYIVTEGMPPYTYLWSNDSTNTTVSNLCAGSYQITVNDINECKRIETVSFIEPEKLEVSVSLSHQACYGDSVDATAIGSGGTVISGYNYLWSDGQTTSTAYHLVDGNYTLTISDINACTDTVAFNIQSPDSIIYDTTTTKVNCLEACNGTAQIEVSGGGFPYSYLWDNGAINNHTNNLCTGAHTLTLTDANGCILKIELNIGIKTDAVPVEATALPQTIYKGAFAQLYAIGQEGYTYHWEPDYSVTNANISNPTTTPFVTTIYKVNVTDSLGCRNSDTTIVYVKDVICDEPFIFVPNAFSPNEDNNNDVLYVRGEMIEELQFSVYNRWGELVFNTTQLNKGWDGVYQGKKVDPAVFVYYLKATCVNKEVFEKKGNVTVVK